MGPNEIYDFEIYPAYRREIDNKSFISVLNYCKTLLEKNTSD
jgi:hypothetical protein